MVPNKLWKKTEANYTFWERLTSESCFSRQHRVHSTWRKKKKRPAHRSAALNNLIERSELDSFFYRVPCERSKVHLGGKGTVMCELKQFERGNDLLTSQQPVVSGSPSEWRHVLLVWNQAKLLIIIPSPYRNMLRLLGDIYTKLH